MSRTLDKLIDIYADKYLNSFPPENTSDTVGISPLKLAKEKLKMDIIEEIVNEKQEEYRQTVLAEMKLELEKSKINQVRTFIIDGLILAFWVGIIVNQSTDIITWLKSLDKISTSYIEATIIILFAVLIIIYISLKYRYIDKLSTLINGENTL